MTKGLIIDFNSVAAYLAHEDAKVQGEFINTFIKELAAICDTRHHAEMQMEYVRKELKPATIEHLEQLTFKPE